MPVDEGVKTKPLGPDKKCLIHKVDTRNIWAPHTSAVLFYGEACFAPMSRIQKLFDEFIITF